MSTLSRVYHTDLPTHPAQADQIVWGPPAAALPRVGFTPPSLNDGFSARATLRESEECAADVGQLMVLAYQKGYREGHADELKTRRTVRSSFAIISLVVIILAGGLFY
jgi:hypothetical protein